METTKIATEHDHDLVTYFLVEIATFQIITYFARNIWYFIFIVRKT